MCTIAFANQLHAHLRIPNVSEHEVGVSAGGVEARGNASGITTIVVIEDRVVEGVGAALLGSVDELSSRNNADDSADKHL
mmetsp:Transcript_45080/g.141916  ORF Transcript_45080/g.141916 Transcript_45080/m.141916 type:complete len:80 (-) Transcript_45080:44-283(-)